MLAFFAQVFVYASITFNVFGLIYDLFIRDSKVRYPVFIGTYFTNLSISFALLFFLLHFVLN